MVTVNDALLLVKFVINCILSLFDVVFLSWVLVGIVIFVPLLRRLLIKLKIIDF